MSILYTIHTYFGAYKWYLCTLTPKTRKPFGGEECEPLRYPSEAELNNEITCFGGDILDCPPRPVTTSHHQNDHGGEYSQGHLRIPVSFELELGQPQVISPNQ